MHAGVLSFLNFLLGHVEPNLCFNLFGNPTRHESMTILKRRKFHLTKSWLSRKAGNIALRLSQWLPLGKIVPILARLRLAVWVFIFYFILGF